MGNASRPDGVQSVDRAVSLLQLIAHRGEARVSDLAVDLGIHKTTAFRLLATLEARGFVEQRYERGKYRLGPALVELTAEADRIAALPDVRR